MKNTAALMKSGVGKMAGITPELSHHKSRTAREQALEGLIAMVYDERLDATSRINAAKAVFEMMK